MIRYLLALGVVAAASPCFAEDRPVLDRAFHNTIVSTYPDGRTAELWLQPDGSYAAEGRRHDRSSGHWKLSGDKMCLKQSHPIPVPFSFCTHLTSAGPGAGWTGKAVTGEPIRIRITRGRTPDAVRTARAKSPADKTRARANADT